MENQTSYVELCIQSLPPEKQAAARNAFHDLLEGSQDDSMLSRLLIVFEATAAYGRTIPQSITAAAEKHIRALDEKLAQLDEKTRQANESLLLQLKKHIEAQLPAMAKELSLHRVTEKLDALRRSIERLQVETRRMRHVRLGAVVIAMLLAGAVFAGGTVALFSGDYQKGKSASAFFQKMASHGVYSKISRGQNGELIYTVEGPVVLHGTGWQKDASGNVTGVNLYFP